MLDLRKALPLLLLAHGACVGVVNGDTAHDDFEAPAEGTGVESAVGVDAAADDPIASDRRWRRDAGTSRDAGTRVDAGPAIDAGAAPVDAGAARVDAGAAPADAGAAPADAGAAPVDAGAAPVDAGAAPVDAGAAPVDAGAAPVDAGAPRDAGTATPDASVTPAQDAGSNNPPAGTVKVGSNSATFTFTFSNTARLTSSPLDVAQGSIVIAGVAMGALANMHAPTDSRGSAYSALTQPRNYTGWLQSGMQLFSASNLPATPSLVVGEDMGAAPNDEVTLSVVEVRGGSRIVGVAEAEHPGSSPVQSGTVTTTGPALLVSWWWGDGGNSQITATPSAGWTRLHALSRAQGMSGFIQVEVATRYVAQAGSYSVAWTADPDQGAVVQIVAVQ